MLARFVFLSCLLLQAKCAWTTQAHRPSQHLRSTAHADPMLPVSPSAAVEWKSASATSHGPGMTDVSGYQILFPGSAIDTQNRKEAIALAVVRGDGSTSQGRDALLPHEETRPGAPRSFMAQASLRDRSVSENSTVAFATAAEPVEPIPVSKVGFAGLYPVAKTSWSSLNVYDTFHCTAITTIFGILFTFVFSCGMLECVLPVVSKPAGGPSRSLAKVAFTVPAGSGAPLDIRACFWDLEGAEADNLAAADEAIFVDWIHGASQAGGSRSALAAESPPTVVYVVCLQRARIAIIDEVLCRVERQLGSSYRRCHSDAQEASDPGNSAAKIVVFSAAAAEDIIALDSPEATSEAASQAVSLGFVNIAPELTATDGESEPVTPDQIVGLFHRPLHLIMAIGAQLQPSGRASSAAPETREAAGDYGASFSVVRQAQGVTWQSKACRAVRVPVAWRGRQPFFASMQM